MYINNIEEAQDNSYNNPEFNNLNYTEYPCQDCPYLRQYSGYPNPMMYPSDEYPAFDEMYRRRRRRRRPFFPQDGFPFWWFFFF
jgi:hypothetical protein